MTAEEAIAFVQETKKAMEAADAEKEALKQKLKDTHALYEQVNLYRELDFSIPELLKFRHIKYRFGRVLKELYPSWRPLRNPLRIRSFISAMRPTTM